jgi:CheY-like chemotaxis protein
VSYAFADVARILLIDDEAEVRAAMRGMLGSAGHEVRAVASGAKGLAALRRHRPDLVLCDVDMPGLDGFGVLRAIRTDPKLAALPFVFLATTATGAGLLFGADDYLVKPVSAAALRAAVDDRLAGARMRHGGQGGARPMRAAAVLLPPAVRTPLTVIIGSAGLLQEFHRDLGPDEIELLAGGILDAALSIHRMAEKHVPDAEPEPPSESSGCADVRSAAREAAFGEGRLADLTLDLHEVAVRIAPAHLRKIVAELVRNAFEFSDRGTAVRVSLRADASGCRLEIVDRGPRMAADRRGAGLALVHDIAEASGGAVEIESGTAAGTTVRVRWRDPGRRDPARVRVHDSRA